MPHSSEEAGGTPADFETALKALEEVVQRLEDGKLGLAESLVAFEEGMRLARLCDQQLQAAQASVELLVNGEDGGTIPFVGDESL